MAKQSYLKFILYLGVIVLLNLAGLSTFFRVDLTRNQVFSLSPASKQAVSTLGEPLSIKVFFSQNLPAPHNNTERYLKDLLTEYAAQGGRYFNFNFYNISSEDAGLGGKSDQNREMARDFGISPVQIRIMENDEVKFKNAYMGLVLIHGDLVEKIPALTSTDGLEYRLTTAIQKMNNKVSALLRLDEKIKATLYLSSSLNPIAPIIGLDQFGSLGKGVEDAVAQLNKQNFNTIQFEQKDLTDPQELSRISQKYDLLTLAWPQIPERGLAAGKGTAALVLSYKDQFKALPLVSAVELPLIGTTYQMADPAVLGDELTAIMEKMIGINKDIGFLSDHGTQRLTPDRMAMMQGRPGNAMQTFNHLVSQRYDIKQIPLKSQGIPEGLNCLIIAKPTEKFTDYELYQIDQALMKGTNLAVFADAFQEQMAPGGMGMPQFTPIDSGLEKLLAHYGITMDPAYVLDKSAYKHPLPPNQGGGEQVIYFAPMLKEAGINTQPEFMKNIKAMVAMQISPLRLNQERIDAQKLTALPILSSSKESWLMEGMINLNPTFITPPTVEEAYASYDLAYLLEGEFTSYFADKPVPEKQMGDTQAPANDADTQKGMAGLTAENRTLTQSKPAKIFVLGATQMLQDNMLDPGGRTTNSTFILNTIDHLNGEDAVAAMRSKQQTFNPLAPTTPVARGIIKGASMAGLPILVCLFGALVWGRRNTRKKQIAKIFND